MADLPDIVERRQRYIQRQIAMNKGDVDVKFRGRRPEGSGPRNRDGMPKLPIGQHQVRNWPVLDLGEQPTVDTARGSSRSAASSRTRSRSTGPVPGLATGGRRQRLSLRHDMEPLR